MRAKLRLTKIRRELCGSVKLPGVELRVFQLLHGLDNSNVHFYDSTSTNSWFNLSVTCRAVTRLPLAALGLRVHYYFVLRQSDNRSYFIDSYRRSNHSQSSSTILHSYTSYNVHDPTIQFNFHPRRNPLPSHNRNFIFSHVHT